MNEFVNWAAEAAGRSWPGAAAAMLLFAAAAAFAAWGASWFSDMMVSADPERLMGPQALDALRRRVLIERTPSSIHLAAAGAGGALAYVVAGQRAEALLPALSFLLPATAASVIDAKTTVIPEELTWLTLFGGLVLSPWAEGMDDSVFGAAVCGAAVWFSLALVGWLKREFTHSGGDVAAAVAAGAWVGWLGVPHYLLATSLSFLVVAGFQRVRGVLWVPMGPAIFAGVPLSVLLSRLLDGAL
jgi:leader peptidase (prepilin peptidase)/N-methyltransferase